MIILKLLNLSDFYNVSKNIDIAKGENKLPQSLKEGYEQIKRKIKWE